MNPEQEQDLARTLDQVNGQLSPALPSPADAAQDGFNVCPVCQKYKSVKGDVDKALGLIGLIPNIGPKIVTLVKSVETIADLACSGCP